MDADRGAPNGRGQGVDQESFIREIASSRTYLMFVAGGFHGARSLPGKGVSDLVDSVLTDAIDEVRGGDDRLTFQSDKKLKAWLVNRLRWKYLDSLEHGHRDDRILPALPPLPGPRTPGSEIADDEQARLLAEALAKLDPADRQLIEWRVDEDLTFKEIGHRRGCSTSYARRACLESLDRLGSIYLSIGGSASP